MIELKNVSYYVTFVNLFAYATHLKNFGTRDGLFHVDFFSEYEYNLGIRRFFVTKRGARGSSPGGGEMVDDGGEFSSSSSFA